MACAAENPEELRSAQGWLRPAPDATELGSAFPALAAAIGVERVTGIALLSTIVGMACPGLHSIFPRPTVDWDTP